MSKIIPPAGVSGGMPALPGAQNVPLIGGVQQIVIQPSALCASCFPKPAPAIVVFAGYSLCPECATKARRWHDDWGDAISNPLAFIDSRRGEEYKKAWGEQHPKEAAEEKL